MTIADRVKSLLHVKPRKDAPNAVRTWQGFTMAPHVILNKAYPRSFWEKRLAALCWMKEESIWRECQNREL